MSTTDRSWSKRLAPYKKADDKRAIVEFALTVVPLIALWVAMWKSLEAATVTGYLLAALALIPAAGLMVRLFILQHDCGHGSMFTSKALNTWVGRCLGIFTFTPYRYWRDLHAAHHATSGNLDGRGIGDIDTLTVNEYRTRDALGRLRYRLYRHPLVLFGLGPAYLFLLRHRLPFGAMRQGRGPWLSTMGTNLGIVAVSWLIIQYTGLTNFLLIQIPVVALAASIGVWFFYIQHQFDDTYWGVKPEWTREGAALQGSSYYDLPWPVMWVTGYIGIHHVHHLSSHIPFHKLPKVLSDFPELKDTGKLKFLESMRCASLALWDEKAKQLISFKTARLQYAGF